MRLFAPTGPKDFAHKAGGIASEAAEAVAPKALTLRNFLLGFIVNSFVVWLIVQLFQHYFELLI
jgi:hypothetical protein